MYKNLELIFTSLLKKYNCSLMEGQYVFIDIRQDLLHMIMATVLEQPINC